MHNWSRYFPYSGRASYQAGPQLIPTTLSLSFTISLLNSDINAPKDLISYKAQNFFDSKPQTDADRYDLIYDFTCVCYID